MDTAKRRRWKIIELRSSSECEKIYRRLRRSFGRIRLERYTSASSMDFDLRSIVPRLEMDSELPRLATCALLKVPVSSSAILSCLLSFLLRRYERSSSLSQSAIIRFFALQLSQPPLVLPSRPTATQRQQQASSGSIDREYWFLTLLSRMAANRIELTGSIRTSRLMAK